MPWTNQLIDLLERKEKLITELSALAGLQAAMVRERRGEALLELLSRRQAIIDEVLGMQDELTAVTAEAAEHENEATPEASGRIKSLIDAISTGLSAVIEHDERDRKDLAGSCAETRRELAAVGNARQAHEAYIGAAGRAETRFADRRC